MNFEELKKVKEKVSDRDEIRLKNYSETISEAYKMISSFSNKHNYSKDELIEIAYKLQEAISYRSSELEPYILLANIFYIFGETENAIKYLQYASSIDSESPLVSKFRNIINDI